MGEGLVESPSRTINDNRSAEKGPDDLSKDRIFNSLEVAVLLSEIFASVRDENSSTTNSQGCRPAGFKNHNGITILVVHLRFLHFVLLDGTLKLQEAVTGKVEVLQVRIHHAGEHVGASWASTQFRD